jgi:hypothetical protein
MLIAKSDPAVNNVGKIIWMLEEKALAKQANALDTGIWGGWG